MQTDTIKGRIKEAFGSLTGNKKLKAKGKTDQAVGKLKSDSDKAVDKVAEKMRD
ncbi:MAG: CsbD family protein [Verrucomicrobia bacterium]|nr:CsbD family protein [Verrucomicrobiota bacterium]